MTEYKFPKGYSQFGAQMGRRPNFKDGTRNKCRLFRVRLDKGGYDNGGAYWGTGLPIWCLLDDDGCYIGFNRALTRADAYEDFQRFHGNFTLAKGDKDYG